MKLEKKQLDALNIELTLNIEKGDYAESVRKKLAQRRRTADFKGFRKGMVPESLVRRVYGDQILAESVNEVIYCCSLRKFPSDLFCASARMDKIVLARSPASALMVSG